MTFPDTDNKNVISDSDNDEADTDFVHKISVQNVKQPENTPAPTVNIPQSQGYAIQKTSPILIIVIIILVLVI